MEGRVLAFGRFGSMVLIFAKSRATTNRCGGRSRLQESTEELDADYFHVLWYPYPDVFLR